MVYAQAAASVFKSLNGHIYGGNNTATMILAHGFGTDQTLWQYMIPTLAYFFKVVVFDLAFSHNVRPGVYNPRRYSTYDGFADDVVSIVDELHLRKVIYVGHSMSAMVGCLAFIKRPHAFQRLVFINGSPRYLNTKGYHGGIDRAKVDSIFVQIRYNYTNWVNTFAPKVVLVHDRRAVSYFTRNLLAMDRKITLSAAKTVYLSDLRWVLPRVRVPTTIIQSKKDIIIPDFVVQYMKKKIRGKCELKVLPTVGHFPQLTAANLVLRVLKALGV